MEKSFVSRIVINMAENTPMSPLFVKYRPENVWALAEKHPNRKAFYFKVTYIRFPLDKNAIIFILNKKISHSYKIEFIPFCVFH